MADTDNNEPKVFSPNNDTSGNQEPLSAPEVPNVSQAEAPQPVNTVTASAPETSAPVSTVPQNAPSTSIENSAGSPVPAEITAPFVPAGGAPKKKKAWLLPAAAIAAVAVLAGAFFGFKQYTSSPNYVWNKSLNNTAAGYEALSDKLSSFDAETYKAADTSGKMSLEVEGLKGSGELKIASGEKNAEGSFDLSVDFEADGGNSISLKAGVDFKAVDKGAEYPDMYVKARGLDKLESLATSIGASPADIKAIVDQYNEKWFVLEGSYIEEQVKGLESMLSSSASAASSAPTPEDLTQFLQKLSGANKEYLFTSNKDKAVLEQKEYVGKETKNGQETYHYKAGINKANLKSYGKGLEKAFVESNLGKWAAEQSSQSASELFDYEAYAKAVDDIKDDVTFDVWINSKDKLVQTIRFYTDDDKKSYGEISLPYKGGDEVPFQVNIHDATTNTSDTDVVLKFTLNTKTNKANFAVNVDNDQGKFVFTGDMTPRGSEPKVTAPTGATSLQQYFDAMLQGYTGSGASLYSESDFDAESFESNFTTLQN